MPGENETRIALIIAGGVSLGNFEAGALAEILYQIETRNKSGDHRYVIDVITGGSAGSITGAMVAKVLVEGNTAERRAMLHDSWVIDGDIGKILKNADPKTDKYVLPVKLQHELAEKYLHPVSGTLDEEVNISVYFTLTNMSGVNYAYPYETRNSRPPNMKGDLPDGFPTTRFEDGYEAEISAKTSADDWKSIALNVIASGANQGAFPPVAIQRKRDAHYKAAKPAHNKVFQVSNEVNFLFTDGGAFNNEPVKKAFELAHERDKKFTGKRRVILVDPYQNRFDDQQVDQDPRWKPGYANKEESEYPTFVQNLVRLVGAFFANAEQKHWIYEQERVGKKNEKRDLAQQAVIGWYKALKLLEEDERQTVMNAVPVGNSVTEENAERVIKALEKYYEDDFDASDPDDKKLLKQIVMAFYDVTDLHKEFVNLAIIRSFPQATAGDDLGAFAGFFDQTWRQYDYALGRSASREVMEKIFDSPLAKEVVDSNPYYSTYQDRVNPKFAGVKIKDADEALRQDVYKYLSKKIKVLLKGEPLRAGGFVRFVASFFIEPKLKEVLGIKRKRRFSHPFRR